MRHASPIEFSKHITSAERILLAVVMALAALAVCGPHLAQQATHHHFIDSRPWLGIQNAADVFSNLPFAAWGLAGLLWLVLHPSRQTTSLRIHVVLTAVFFAGLIATAGGSAWYHLRPDDAGLLIDRLGMTMAFAGLLGLAAAERVSARAGCSLAAVVLTLGPLSLAVWFASGNVLPWAVVQFGGLVLLTWLALRKPLPGALPVNYYAVIAIYVVAKVLELGDAAVFSLTSQFVSGHTLKHVVASFAACPVLFALISQHRIKAKSASTCVSVATPSALVGPDR